jgi:hypothetical protein
MPVTVEMKDKIFSEKYKRDFKEFEKDVAEKISLLKKGKIEILKVRDWRQLEYGLKESKGKLKYSLMMGEEAVELGKDSFPSWFQPEKYESHEKELMKLWDRVEATGNYELREKLFETIHLTREQREELIKIDGIPNECYVQYPSQLGISNTSEHSLLKGLIFTLFLFTAPIVYALSSMIKPAYAQDKKQIPKINPDQFQVDRPLTDDEKKLLLPFHWIDPNNSRRWMDMWLAHDNQYLKGVAVAPFDLYGEQSTYNGVFDVHGDASHLPNLDDVLFRIGLLQRLSPLPLNQNILPYSTEVCLTPGDGKQWPTMHPVDMSTYAYRDTRCTVNTDDDLIVFKWAYPMNGLKGRPGATVDIPPLIGAGNNRGYWGLSSTIFNRSTLKGITPLEKGNVSYPDDDWAKAYPQGLSLPEFQAFLLPILLAASLTIAHPLLKRRKHV